MEYFSKCKYVVLSISVAIILQGCDWIKGQMGMPTSKDIEQMKLELQIKEQQRLHEEAEKARREQDSIMNAAKVAVPQLEGYFVVLGSFKDHRNAHALDSLVRGMGVASQQVLLKNGFKMVVVGSFGTFSAAVREMERIGDMDFCPYDMWVYGASQGLHQTEE